MIDETCAALLAVEGFTADDVGLLSQMAEDGGALADALGDLAVGAARARRGVEQLCRAARAAELDPGGLLCHQRQAGAGRAPSIQADPAAVAAVCGRGLGLEAGTEQTPIAPRRADAERGFELVEQLEAQLRPQATGRWLVLAGPTLTADDDGVVLRWLLPAAGREEGTVVGRGTTLLTAVRHPVTGAAATNRTVPEDLPLTDDDEAWLARWETAASAALASLCDPRHGTGQRMWAQRHAAWAHDALVEAAQLTAIAARHALTALIAHHRSAGHPALSEVVAAMRSDWQGRPGGLLSAARLVAPPLR